MSMSKLSGVTLALGLLATGPAGSADAQLLGALSEQEEIEVGRQAAAEIERGLTLVTDELVTSYVADLGQRLARRSERSDIDYTFKVVDSAEINAFALPGGFIYVNRGLIEAADNEAEVAGVIGHEIGHVVARHGAEQVQRATYANLGLRVLGSLLGRGTRAQIGNLAAEMAATGVFMKFGRDAEREADRLGATNVAAVGLDPQGMITFFEKLGALRESQPNVVERFFASHPQPAERIDNISDLVHTLRRDLDATTTTSRRFEAVKTRLTELPPPTAEDAATASPSAPETLADAGQSTSSDLVPVTYPGAERDQEIAARFAPTFWQALGPDLRFDYIAPFDFDGDWQGDNNWENVADLAHPLLATVYFNVSETDTHYFIHYAAFHPRDYKGGNLRGVILSEILREGAERHGDYDPTGLAEAAVLAHENDMEGALVVVEKGAGFFGRPRVRYVETLAHNQFLAYRVQREQLSGLTASSDSAVRVEGERPVLFIEPKGHGIEAFRGGDQLESAENGFVIYRYAGRAEEPTGNRDEEVGYDLHSLARTLWPAARAKHSGVYGGAFDYGRWTIRVRRSSGGEEDLDTAVGSVGSLLRGETGGANMARPPWGWYDQDETDQRQGAWFMTPAETVKRHFDLDDRFSTTYVHHPILGVYRD